MYDRGALSLRLPDQRPYRFSHPLRRRFVQFLFISLDLTSWKLHKVLAPNCQSQQVNKARADNGVSNSGSFGHEADALPDDKGHST